MNFDWRKIAQIGAQVAGAAGVPGAVIIEQGVEGVVDAKSGQAKETIAVETGIQALRTATTTLGSKQDLATPRVVAAIRGINGASVELLNALAEAEANNDAAWAPTAADSPKGV